jgi:predicted GNAT family N-acyltransferase
VATGTDYIFEILNETHDRPSFSCGVPSLDAYFHRQAGQDVRRRLASVFILRAPNTFSVVGYYTLSNYAVTATELPPNVVKKFGRYPTLPATLLGRLAVDERYKGQKFGQRLLLNALQRSAHNELASAFVVVDALDEQICPFYEKYGFQRFGPGSLRLFLPMETIQSLMQAQPAGPDATPTD